MQGLKPRGVDHEGHGHIGEQGQGQPFQDPDVAVVGHENLQKQGDQGEAHDEDRA